MIITQKAKIELIPSESGKTWVVKETFTVYSKRYKKYITIPRGYKHDRYTVVPNLSDDLPAIVHDFLYDNRKFDDGTKCTKVQTDLIFYDLIRQIDNWQKYLCYVYYTGVVIFGVIPWTLGSLNHEK